MGFRDAEWAYGLELPMVQKVVLVAVCHRTTDSTHETFVGQRTIAAMIGSSSDSVRRALGALESAGFISRQRRHGAGGYRTSDLITVLCTASGGDQRGSVPTRQTAHKADGPNLTGSQSQPNRQSAGAEEITPRTPSRKSRTRVGARTDERRLPTVEHGRLVDEILQDRAAAEAVARVVQLREIAS